MKLHGHPWYKLNFETMGIFCVKTLQCVAAGIDAKMKNDLLRGPWDSVLEWQACGGIEI
jgi:hypothetical protein